MSRLVSKILLAILMLPAAAIFYVGTAAISHEYLYRSFGISYLTMNRDSFAFLLAGIASAAFMSAYWFLLWRKSIRWNAQRMLMTLLAALVSLVFAVSLGSFIRILADHELGYAVGGLSLSIPWLIATVFIWRDSKSERIDRAAGTTLISCRVCGYNLTGLRSTTCPECGASPTLDELLSAQGSSQSDNLSQDK
ncbi:MAG TPA: hypothetical protein VG711_04015 [Phycisphaerales bacterium]|nr:hypothetical protein [Phycisphaerales bacterium]